MGLVVRPVETIRDLRAFIEIPWRIHRNTPQWVPPLRMDIKRRLNPQKHPFFDHAVAEYFVAWQDDQPVGRIAAIRNELYEWFHHEPVGFFGFFDTVQDLAVARALMDAAAHWVRTQGLQVIRGPTNLSTNEEVGLLVEGFDRRPAILMPYNPPYYAEFMERLGLQKVKDLWAWEMDRTTIRMDPFLEFRDPVVRRWGPRLQIRTLELRRLREEADLLRGIYNDAWSENWGFVPMTQREFLAMARELKPIADPDLAIVAEWDSHPVAFAIGIPDINELLIRVRSGRLLPFGWWTILRGLRRIRSFRIITLGVRRGFKRRGIDVLLFCELYERGMRKGYERVECSWVLEDNHLLNRALARIGAQRTKVYRIYEMSI